MKKIYLDSAASSVRSRKFVDSYCQLLGKNRSKEDKIKLLLFAAGKIANLLNVDISSISFVPNATYALNEIAYALKDKKFKRVFIGSREHSSNHVIWLKLFGQEVFYLDLENFESWNLNVYRSIFSFSLMSNLEGICLNIEEISNKFSNHNHVCVIDASQYIQHSIPDLSNSSVDYFIFSAHKFFGPNGLGVIFSKSSDGIGINFLNYSEDYSLDWSGLEAWNMVMDEIFDSFKSGLVSSQEFKLRKYFEENFPKNEYVRWINSEQKSCIFLIEVTSEFISSHDYAFYLAKKGIIVRSGISCSWLSLNNYLPEKIFRVSLSFLNSIQDLQFFFRAIRDFRPDDCF